MYRTWFAAAALISATIPSSIAAKVDEASASGFAVSGEQVLLGVSASGVWSALVQPGQWWSGEHSWSTDATNMTLDPVAGGCFCEILPGHPSGSVEHMRVVYAMPGEMLRMRGGLGPLQSEALTGTLTIELSDAQRDADAEGGDNGVTIAWSYVVGGYARFPLGQIAPVVDGVIAEQMGRLADHLTTAE